VLQPTPISPASAICRVAEHRCLQCGEIQIIQFVFESLLPIISGSILFPPDNRYKCKKCQTENDIAELRQQIELQTGKKIL
jgi:hypothetical protein